MRKHRKLCLFLFLSFLVGTLASCGSPGQQTGPVEFSPDVLEWGMSQQEVLDAFALSGNDVRTESIEIPATENIVPSTVTKLSYDNFVFEDLPFRATFTFTEYHAASDWEIGLTELYLEILDNSVNSFADLKSAFNQSHLNTFLYWEDLSEQERKKMHEFYKAVFPNTTAEMTEIVDISGGGGECMPKKDADGVYSAYYLTTNGLGVWNRYVKDTR